MPYSNRHRSARGRATGYRQIYGQDNIPTQHHLSDARKDIRRGPRTSLCRSPGNRDCPHPELGLSIQYTMRYRVQSRSEEHTSELQSLMRISYAVFCLKKKKQDKQNKKFKKVLKTNKNEINNMNIQQQYKLTIIHIKITMK